MQLIWFERTRWFWYPVSVNGWFLLSGHALIALLLSAWALANADSVLSALYGLMLGNGLCFLWFDWLARRTSYRDGRHLRRHQRDMESWT
jgi:hypothetical protein